MHSLSPLGIAEGPGQVHSLSPLGITEGPGQVHSLSPLGITEGPGQVHSLYPQGIAEGAGPRPLNAVSKGTLTITTHFIPIQNETHYTPSSSSIALPTAERKQTSKLKRGEKVAQGTSVDWNTVPSCSNLLMQHVHAPTHWVLPINYPSLPARHAFTLWRETLHYSFITITIVVTSPSPPPQ